MPRRPIDPDQQSKLARHRVADPRSLQPHWPPAWPRPKSARRLFRYVADRDAIAVVTIRHAGFLIPHGWIGTLQDVPIEELAELEIWPDGSAVELESRDIHISVDGLATVMGRSSS